MSFYLIIILVAIKRLIIPGMYGYFSYLILIWSQTSGSGFSRKVRIRLDPDPQHCAEF
jgi:multisubunit Na+/H+ antiporter MnhB subunit